MTYSSALYSGQGETLEQAQRNKYASICDRMRLKSGDHVLEIGCGWGGFAEYAIRERGAQRDGPDAQPRAAGIRPAATVRGRLADRAEIVIRDYREEAGCYDGVASIEMFEAVGERYWPTYFRTVFQRLRPGRRGLDPDDHDRREPLRELSAEHRLHPEIHLPGRNARRTVGRAARRRARPAWSMPGRWSSARAIPGRCASGAAASTIAGTTSRGSASTTGSGACGTCI